MNTKRPTTITTTVLFLLIFFVNQHSARAEVCPVNQLNWASCTFDQWLNPGTADWNIMSCSRLEVCRFVIPVYSSINAVSSSVASIQASIEQIGCWLFGTGGNGCTVGTPGGPARLQDVANGWTQIGTQVTALSSSVAAIPTTVSNAVVQEVGAINFQQTVVQPVTGAFDGQIVQPLTTAFNGVKGDILATVKELTDLSEAEGFATITALLNKNPAGVLSFIDDLIQAKRKEILEFQAKLVQRLSNLVPMPSTTCTFYGTETCTSCRTSWPAPQDQDYFSFLFSVFGRFMRLLGRALDSAQHIRGLPVAELRPVVCVLVNLFSGAPNLQNEYTDAVGKWLIDNIPGLKQLTDRQLLIAPVCEFEDLLCQILPNPPPAQTTAAAAAAAAVAPKHHVSSTDPSLLEVLRDWKAIRADPTKTFRNKCDDVVGVGSRTTDEMRESFAWCLEDSTAMNMVVKVFDDKRPHVQFDNGLIDREAQVKSLPSSLTISQNCTNSGPASCWNLWCETIPQASHTTGCVNTDDQFGPFIAQFYPIAQHFLQYPADEKDARVRVLDMTRPCDEGAVGRWIKTKIQMNIIRKLVFNTIIDAATTDGLAPSPLNDPNAVYKIVAIIIIKLLLNVVDHVVHETVAACELLESKVNQAILKANGEQVSEISNAMTTLNRIGGIGDVNNTDAPTTIFGLVRYDRDYLAQVSIGAPNANGKSLSEIVAEMHDATRAQLEQFVDHRATDITIATQQRMLELEQFVDHRANDITSDVSTLSYQVSEIRTLVNQIVQSLGQHDTTVKTAVENVKSAADAHDTSVNTALNNVKTAVENVKSAVDAHDTSVNTALENVKSAADAHDTSVNTALNNVKTAVENVKSAADAHDTSVNTAVNNVKTAVENVKSAADAHDTSVNTALNNVKTAVENVKSAADAHDTSVNTALENVKSAADVHDTNVKTALNSHDSSVKATIDGRVTALDTRMSLFFKDVKCIMTKSSAKCYEECINVCSTPCKTANNCRKSVGCNRQCEEPCLNPYQSRFEDFSPTGPDSSITSGDGGGGGGGVGVSNGMVAVVAVGAVFVGILFGAIITVFVIRRRGARGDDGGDNDGQMSSVISMETIRENV